MAIVGEPGAKKCDTSNSDRGSVALRNGNVIDKAGRGDERMTDQRLAPLLANLDSLLPELEAIYKDIHAHPELSMQETRTARIAETHLKSMGFEVTAGVGKTGVVGLLRNGEGSTVMLRADMDALPIEEATGLAYASQATGTTPEGKTVPVAHSCGHDMHVACLIGAPTCLPRAVAAGRGR